VETKQQITAKWQIQLRGKPTDRFIAFVERRRRLADRRNSLYDGMFVL